MGWGSTDCWHHELIPELWNLLHAGGEKRNMRFTEAVLLGFWAYHGTCPLSDDELVAFVLNDYGYSISHLHVSKYYLGDSAISPGDDLRNNNCSNPLHFCAETGYMQSNRTRHQNGSTTCNCEAMGQLRCLGEKVFYAQ